MIFLLLKLHGKDIYFFDSYNKSIKNYARIVENGARMVKKVLF